MDKQFKRLTVTVQAWFTKTLNGSSGTSSFLMRGGEVPYQFEGKTNVKVGELEEFIKENNGAILDDLSELRKKAKEKGKEEKIQLTMFKEEFGVSRVVKGIRGAVRHRVMDILHQKEISYCSPTLKKEFKSNNVTTLLQGEHIMGGCGEEPCPVRQLFGILGERSPVRIWSDIIVQTDRTVEKIHKRKGQAYVYVSTEQRHAARRDRKALLDFSEQYFSGEFNFYVEIVQEIPQWLLGLLIEGILGITHLGAGENAGYGRLEILNVAYERISIHRRLGEEKAGKIAIVEEETAFNLNDTIEETLQAWKNYKQKENS